MRHEMRHPAFVCLISALALVCAASEEAGVSVRDAWIRETPPGMSVMAGYIGVAETTRHGTSTGRPQAARIPRAR